jgi:MFS transporter, AAHS family, vanillate permease
MQRQHVEEDRITRLERPGDDRVIFAISWTPRLLTAAGLATNQRLKGGILLNVGGIAGCLLYTWGASRADARWLLTVALGATALLIGVFALSMSNIDAALWIALLVGMIANAAMAGLYAVGPTLYPSAVRATGMGSAIGRDPGARHFWRTPG